MDSAAAAPVALLADAFALAVDATAGDTEIAWYAARASGDISAVLDAGCGIGRLLVPLRERGLPVHGVDASASALALCAQRLPGDAPPLVRQSPAALNVPFRYGMAYFGAGALQRFADPMQAAEALARVAAHLVEPGVLVVDLVIPAIARHPPGAPVIEVRTAAGGDGGTLVARSETTVDSDGRRIAWRTRFERREGTRIVAREDVRGTLTWYEPDEMVTLLRECGYTDIEVVASPHPLTANDAQRFAVVARAAPLPS
jgi:SAM-dependent methyltransferase